VVGRCCFLIPCLCGKYILKRVKLFIACELTISDKIPLKNL
jgi:hypothetical protein